MKKLIAILTAISLTSVSASSVVACGIKVDPIDILIDGRNIKSESINIDGVNYWAKDINAATTAFNNQYTVGDSKTKITTSMGFNELNDRLFRLISSDTSLITKTQNNYEQLRNYRDSFLGRDAKDFRITKDSKGFYVPSIDGLRFNGIEPDEDKYYENMKDTSVNSIQGLYNLSKYDGSKLSENTPLHDSWKEANKLFSNGSDDGVNLHNSLKKSGKYSRFMNVQYSAVDGKPMFTEYSTYSQKFNFDTNTGEFKSTDSSKIYGKNNGVDEEKITKEITNPINNRPNYDPFGRLRLQLQDETLLNDLNGENKNYSVEPKTNLLLDEKNSFSETLHKLDGKTEPSVLYSSIDKNRKNKDPNSKPDYEFKYNNLNFYYAIVKPIKVTYIYETNTHDVNQNSVYEISFDLDNLVEEFAPVVQERGNDKDQKNVKNYQIFWTFTGYKFLSDSFEGYNTPIISKDDTTNYVDNVRYELNHQMRDLKTSNWTIEKQKK